MAEIKKLLDEVIEAELTNLSSLSSDDEKKPGGLVTIGLTLFQSELSTMLLAVHSPTKTLLVSLSLGLDLVDTELV